MQICAALMKKQSRFSQPFARYHHTPAKISSMRVAGDSTQAIVSCGVVIVQENDATAGAYNLQLHIATQQLPCPEEEVFLGHAVSFHRAARISLLTC